MRRHTDVLLRRIEALISSGDPYGDSGAVFTVGDLLSESYVICYDRQAEWGRPLTDAELKTVIRSVAISRGRERLPIVRFSRFTLEEVESTMRTLVGISEDAEADPDTEFTQILMDISDDLGVEDLYRQYGVIQ